MSPVAAILLQNADTPTPGMGSQIVLKLLDWPFLLFVALVLILLLFRPHFASLFSRGDISLSWGDRSIRLRELSKNLDKELDPIRDEIDGLKRELSRLGTPAAAPQAERDSEREQRLALARERIAEGLRSGKYDWRSIERLGTIGGVPEDEVLDLLRADPDVVLGTGKDGRPIAGLRARVGR